MRPKFFLPLVTILITTMLLAPHRAQACTCGIDPFRNISPFWTAFAASDVVFLGTLSSIEEPPLSEPFSSTASITYTVKVHHVWKGVEGTTIQVTTTRDSASCGATLQLGETYMFYEGRNPTKPSDISTSRCSYTHPTRTMSSYWYDLSYLGQSFGMLLGLRENFDSPY